MSVSRTSTICLIALAYSALGLALMMLVLLYFELPRELGIGLSLVIPFVLGGLIALWRPVPARLAGPCAGGAFCAYFAGVFIALLYNSEKEWLPAVLAVSTIAASWLGSLVAGFMARAGSARRISVSAGQEVHR